LMNFLEVRNWIGEETESRSQMPNILALPGENVPILSTKCATL